MTKRLQPVVFAAILLITGCAGIQNAAQRFLDAPPWWQAGQAEAIRRQAEALEADGELAMALAHWRVVQHITLGNKTATAEIKRLQQTIRDAVDAHYHEGLVCLRRKDAKAAKRHFLIALRLDPAFTPALQQIQLRFSPFPLTVYRSHADEDLGDVAEKRYGSRDKAYLVAWFNDLDEDAPLAPGTLLMLPKSAGLPAASPRRKPSPPVPSLITLATKRLSAGDLDGALALARKGDPANPKVRDLIDAIQLEKATAAIENDQLDTAEAILATVSGDASGKRQVLAALRKRRTTLDLNQVRVHLRNGRYHEALDLADGLLAARPGNDAIRDTARDARYRLALDEIKKEQFLSARETLAAADTGHSASMALKARVDQQLQKMAQDHYRNGVKHFINEELKAAIREWELALACNPDHEKARENIDNARRLLKKIKDMP